MGLLKKVIDEMSPGYGRYVMEGTWAVPNTLAKMKELQNVMKNPIRADEAADILYNLVGDDELFDFFAELEDASPGEVNDVRFSVASLLDEWVKDMSGMRTKWDPKAIELGERLVKQYMVN